MDPLHPNPHAGSSPPATGPDLSRPMPPRVPIPAPVVEDEPEVSEKLLKYIADEALAYPPKDISVLTASVAKFLLTSLEPAMRMAEEIREQVSRAEPNPLSVEIVAADRREEALLLLGA